MLNGQWSKPHFLRITTQTVEMFNLSHSNKTNLVMLTTHQI